MQPSSQGQQDHSPGSLRLFKFRGINVFVHWSWALVAIFVIQNRIHDYHSPVWNVIEYLSLFVIVTLHEFGHALACKSVGGEANRIMLWPLGGIAFVNPPPRAGAYLWSIVAGPLVNVALAPITIGVYWWYGSSTGIEDYFHPSTDLARYLLTLTVINLFLLIFNMLPIYPLDGGQTLRGILWFFIGPIRSLSISAKIGLVGVVGLAALAFLQGDYILGVIAIFAGFQCVRGLQQAKWLSSIMANPPRTRSTGSADGFVDQNAFGPAPGSPYTSRTPVPVAMPVLSGRPGAHCPKCRRPAPVGPLWQCECGRHFDIFAEYARCPECQALQTVTGCPYCGEFMPTTAWNQPPSIN